jgi:hypothetical protein
VARDTPAASATSLTEGVAPACISRVAVSSMSRPVLALAPVFAAVPASASD